VTTPTGGDPKFYHARITYPGAQRFDGNDEKVRNKPEGGALGFPVGAARSSRCDAKQSRGLTEHNRIREANMTKEFLGERRAGLENAFFAQQDAILLRRLKDISDTEAEAAALSRASGITNEVVLEKLRNQNVTHDALTALSLAPMVIVAWADGKIDDKERSAILFGAEQAGLRKQSAGYQIFEGWLTRKPSSDLTETWKAYISAICPTLSEDDRQALKSELLGRAQIVAEASGDFLGLGYTVSAAEQAVLDDLDLAFS
jgi:hypothetical protein